MTQFSEQTSKQIADMCKRHKIKELSLFGSRSRGDSMAKSDYDFLVEFSKDSVVTFMTLGAVQTELEEIVHERVDVVPKEGLKSVIRNSVLADTQTIYYEK